MARDRRLLQAHALLARTAARHQLIDAASYAQTEQELARLRPKLANSYEIALSSPV